MRSESAFGVRPVDQLIEFGFLSACPHPAGCRSFWTRGKLQDFLGDPMHIDRQRNAAKTDQGKSQFSFNG